MATSTEAPVYRGPALPDLDFTEPKGSPILGMASIALVLAAWIVVFCVYGQQIIALTAPFAK